MTLVTTLFDAAAYQADALAELYGTRWRIEENLKSLKQTMKMDVLKCMTVDRVLKELTMYHGPRLCPRRRLPASCTFGAQSHDL